MQAEAATGPSLLYRLHLTLMRPPFVKRQTNPLSGFLLFFPPFRSWRDQHLVSCSDLISVHGRQRCVAAPNTY